MYTELGLARLIDCLIELSWGMSCRMGCGTEAPEAAKAFLDDKKYVPSSAHDMWAFGQLLLELLGGCKDPAHLTVIALGGDTVKFAADLLSAPPGTYADKLRC